VPTAAAVATPAPSAATPAGSPSGGAPRGTLVVHGTGDVNLDPAYIPALRSRGYEHAWTGLHGLFADDDLTVVNMECPVSVRGTIVRKEFNFRCDPAALPAARAAGVDVANLANNHSGDFGQEALLDSVDRLRSNGIAPVGVGENLRAASTPAVVERDGWRIAVLGFGGSSRRPTGSRARAAPGWPAATTPRRWRRPSAPLARWRTSCSSPSTGVSSWIRSLGPTTSSGHTR
jgi:poly-gamma-glutamate synthesis protein (capsule biosynthesis protein)